MMITAEKALEKVISTTQLFDGEERNLVDSLHSVLYEDVLSPIHMPPFSQSAMDGYAICGINRSEFRLVGEIQAGQSAERIELNPGEAVRIFTGAMIPKNASAVVRQEDVDRSETEIKVTVDSVQQDANIRFQGEQIKKGELALPKGTVLNPGAIGFLATLGFERIKVFRKPKVKIIITGNELVAPGNELNPGEIYESNAVMLEAAFKSIDLIPEIIRVKDDLTSTKNSISKALQDCQLLITTGGISVGDYDFIFEGMELNGVKTEFYKVRQKPGKPLYYGTLNGTSVFGLPGNPAAVLSCFYVYILPAVRKMMGIQKFYSETRHLKLTSNFTKKAGLTHFLKGKMNGDKVDILHAQSSAMLSSYHLTDCLLVMKEDKEEWVENEKVEVIILPQ